MKKLLLLALGLFPMAARAQPKFRPYAGLHGSGDAQMYYLRPSGQIGVDYRLNKRVGLTAYGHYFHRRIDRQEGSTRFEKGRFNCLTGALLVQLYLGGSSNRGAFVGAGVAVQRVEDEFISDWTTGWHTRRRDVLPAIRFGYSFPLGPHQLTAELNATGPYQEYKAQYNLTETELITQLSVGTRFIW